MALFPRSRSGASRERIEPRLIPVAASPENPSTPLSNPDAWLVDWATGGSPGMFGPAVSEQSAMAVSAVYRCTALVSGIIAGLPLKVYRDDENKGRVEVPDHKYSNFFGLAPYPGRAMSSFVWRELWSINTSLWGNHYSVIRYNAAGRIMGFEPAPPWQTEAVRIRVGPRKGQNAYVVTWDGGEREPVAQEDMLHIPGLGFDGMRGYSRIRHFARNAVSLAKLFEEQTGRVHENAARPSMAVELPPKIDKDGLLRMQAFFEERYTGRMNVGKPLFIDNGTKVTPFQMTPEDLQTIESRRFQIADICRFWGVPPHLVGEAANTSAWGSGIEQLTIGFLIFTLEAELQRIEAELRLKLFAGSEHYARFDRDALRALDVVNDATAAQTEINSGVLTINERRRFKHRPAVPGGDAALVNSTMIPLLRALNPPQPPKPEPGGPPPSQESK